MPDHDHEDLQALIERRDTRTREHTLAAIRSSEARQATSLAQLHADIHTAVEGLQALIEAQRNALTQLIMRADGNAQTAIRHAELHACAHDKHITDDAIFRHTVLARLEQIEKLFDEVPLFPPIDRPGADQDAPRVADAHDAARLVDSVADWFDSLKPATTEHAADATTLSGPHAAADNAAAGTSRPAGEPA